MITLVHTQEGVLERKQPKSVLSKIKLDTSEEELLEPYQHQLMLLPEEERPTHEGIILLFHKRLKKLDCSTSSRLWWNGRTYRTYNVRYPNGRRRYWYYRYPDGPWRTR